MQHVRYALDIKFIRNMIDLLDVDMIRLQRYASFSRQFRHCNVWSSIISYYNEL